MGSLPDNVLILLEYFLWGLQTFYQLKMGFDEVTLTSDQAAYKKSNIVHERKSVILWTRYVRTVSTFLTNTFGDKWTGRVEKAYKRFQTSSSASAILTSLASGTSWRSFTLFKKSRCCFCLAWPVFIIIAWNRVRSSSHSLQSVRAVRGKKVKKV